MKFTGLKKVRFNDCLDDDQKKNLKMLKTIFKNKQEFKTRFKELKNIGKIYEITALLNYREGNSEVLKLEAFSGREIIKRFDTDKLNNLNTFITKIGGFIDLELFLVFGLLNFNESTFTDLFFLMNGLIQFFLHVAQETVEITWDSTKHMIDSYLYSESDISKRQEFKIRHKEEEYYEEALRKINKKEKVNIRIYIKENLNKIFLFHEDIYKFFVSTQKYALSSISYLKKLNLDSESKYMNPLKNLNNRGDILCKKSDPIYLPNLSKEFNFIKKELPTKIFASNIKEIQYHEKFKTLILLQNNSAIINFYDLLKSKYLKFIINLNDYIYKEHKLETINAFRISSDGKWLGLIFNHYFHAIFNFDLEKAHKKNISFERVLEPDPFIFNNNHKVIQIEFLKEFPLLLCFTEKNEILLWSNIFEQLRVFNFLREPPKSKKIFQIEAKLYPNSFCEIPKLGWFAVAAMDKFIYCYDLKSKRIASKINSEVFVHTIKSDSYLDQLFAFSYETEFLIYKLDRYNKEKKDQLRMLGHVSSIIAAEYFLEYNILITCDEMGNLNSWDMKNSKKMQSFKIKSDSQVTKIFRVGNLGFIVVATHFIHFLIDFNSGKFKEIEPETKSFLLSKKRIKKKNFIIPEIIFSEKDTNGIDFTLSSSKEMRSYDLGSGLLNFRYDFAKTIDLNAFVTCFAKIEHPFVGWALGLESGKIILVPEGSEYKQEYIEFDSMIIKTKKEKRKNINSHRINHICSDNKFHNLYVANQNEISKIELKKCVKESKRKLIKISLLNEKHATFLKDLNEENVFIKNMNFSLDNSIIYVNISNLILIILRTEDLMPINCIIELIDKEKNPDLNRNMSIGVKELEIAQSAIKMPIVATKEVLTINEIAFFFKKKLAIIKRQSQYLTFFKIEKNNKLTRVFEIELFKRGLEKPESLRKLTTALLKLKKDNLKETDIVNRIINNKSTERAKKMNFSEMNTEVLGNLKFITKQLNKNKITKALENGQSVTLLSLFLNEETMNGENRILFIPENFSYFLCMIGEKGKVVFMILDFFIAIYDLIKKKINLEEKFKKTYLKPYIFNMKLHRSDLAYLSSGNFNENCPRMRIYSDFYLKLETGQKKLINVKMISLGKLGLLLTMSEDMQLKVWNIYELVSSCLVKNFSGKRFFDIR